MVNFFSLALAFTAVSSAWATPIKRSTEDVLAAIAEISTATTNLDNLITAYPSTGGTLTGALAIHNSATSLNGVLTDATAVVNSNGPVDHPDADEILNAILAIEPTIDHALEGIVDKKPAFDALPLGGVPALVLSDLTTLKASAVGFANALISDAPADLVDEGTAYRDRLLAAFDVAIAAY